MIGRALQNPSISKLTESATDVFFDLDGDVSISSLTAVQSKKIDMNVKGSVKLEVVADYNSVQIGHILIKKNATTIGEMTFSTSLGVLSNSNTTGTVVGTVVTVNMTGVVFAVGDTLSVYSYTENIPTTHTINNFRIYAKQKPAITLAENIDI